MDGTEFTGKDSPDSPQRILVKVKKRMEITINYIFYLVGLRG